VSDSWEIKLRQEIFLQITDYADALRSDEEDPISREELDAYYEAAAIALTGEVPK
jgi:hypothetical protein